MTTLTPGSAFPEGVSFTYIAPTGSLDLTVCGLPIKYDASKGTHTLTHHSNKASTAQY
jgi:alkyl hydroperoxide reductase 1